MQNIQMQAKHIQEWSIVRLPDLRIGVLSHHAPRGKSIVLLENGRGVEINNTVELECIVTTAIGMQEYLAQKYGKSNGSLMAKKLKLEKTERGFARKEGVEMQKDIFEKALKRKVSQITFSGHRVNDDYSLNKRKAIMTVAISAFDEAAQESAQASGPENDYARGVKDGDPYG